jgi:hypothetical protein
MKRQLSFLLSGLFFSTVIAAQAHESSIEYNKKKQTSIEIEYPYPAEAVENAIVKKMEKVGYKTKEEKGLFNKDKGFRGYKNANIPDISDKTMDYVIKVERKGKKDDDRAVLNMVMMQGEENAMSSMDAYDIGKAKDFLNNLLPEVEAANLELQIKAQEEVIAKAEKKLSKLQKDKSEMEDKIKKLEKDIEGNTKDQENTQKDIETQKEVLENLKSKRKGF